MIKALTLGVALAGLGAALVMPASAEVRFDPGLNAKSAQPVILAQYYGGRGYYGRGYGGRGYYGRGYGPGAGVAAGIAGLAAGAIIGGAIASQAQPVYPAGDAVSYCLSRFKSYDPQSGTYLGYDGYRHPCP